MESIAQHIITSNHVGRDSKNNTSGNDEEEVISLCQDLEGPIQDFSRPEALERVGGEHGEEHVDEFSFMALEERRCTTFSTF